jgi:RimJ/RimL family protein N-acetyltransferase
VTTFALREPVLTDAEWITQACQDTEVQRWTLVPRPYKREHALGFIDNTINEAHRWVIEYQETNKAVGVVSIHTIDPDTGDANTGYWIAPWGRRQGAAVASRATASRAGFINMGSTQESCPDGESLVPALTYVKHLTR